MTRTRTLPSIARLTGAVVVMLLASVRCQVALDPEPLQRFDTCDNLQVFLEDQILHPSVDTSFQSGGIVGCTSGDLAAPSAGLRDNAIGEGEGERSFTTTNTQEVAVDEPDFVKNNGDVIFVLRRGEMIILQAWPANDMKVLSRTPIAGTPFTMLFDDDGGGANKRALVVSNIFSDKQRVLVRLYDVSDYAAPVELRTTLIDGDFVDARSVDGQVMLVTRAQLNIDVQLDSAPFADDDNRARLRAAGLGRILPQVSDFIDGQDIQPRVDKAIACENTYAPAHSDGRSILLVHTLDLNDETAPLRSTGVVAGFSNVYASTTALYLASTEFSDGGYFTPSFATTRVHALAAFTGDGAAEYTATGVFTGQIKDELSLDEGPDGSLRMVLTDNSASQDLTKQTTSLVVVQADGTQLKEISRVEDLGRGEAVESVRFLGDKAYVVTYPVGSPFFINQGGFPSLPFTDPLFIVDLADPKAPALRGSVEVAGYSAYIHPLDDGHILTVGVNTDAATGAMQSLSLMIFDVTDADAPSLAQRLDFGDANTASEALVDRHAFTYFPEQQTLALPVQRFDPSAGALSSTALAVFHIDIAAGITEVGEIEQKALFSSASLNGVTNTSGLGPCAAVRRGVMISDPTDGTFVYAVSTAGVSAVSLADGLPTASIVKLLADNDATCAASGAPL